MRKYFVFLFIVMCMGLTGCATGRYIDLSQADAESQFGPMPENYQQLVITAISNQLIDPHSGLFRFGDIPKPGEIISIGSGWYGLVQVNGKNRLGGYAGFIWWEYLINNGQVVYAGEHVLGKMARGY